ncbi:MAG TPA: formyltransferase family protein [bacterium]|nr:formyltransferase family protein [bacterium]
MSLKISLLCHNIDFKALSVLYYFCKKNNYPIDSIIIEESINKKVINEPITWKLLRKRYKPNLIKKIISKILYFIRLENIISFFPESKYFKTISMKRAARKLKIPCYFVKNHSSEETKQIFESRSINYALLISSNYLIKDILLKIPVKIINAHCALLPKHRSLDSLPWSVIAKDKLGITTHFVDEGIDTGEILLFEEIKPYQGDDLISFRRKMDEQIPAALYQTIIKLEKNEITPQKQKLEDGIRHRIMTEEEFELAQKLFNQNYLG